MLSSVDLLLMVKPSGKLLVLMEELMLIKQELLLKMTASFGLLRMSL
jgi:hypothetical protein